MINKKFEAYKLRREIKRSGTTLQLSRNGKNKFGEPNGVPLLLGSIDGLYHEENSTVQIKVGSETQYRNKKVPAVLCLYSDVFPIGLKVGDIVQMGTKQYTISGIVDIQGWNIVADISMTYNDTDVAFVG